MYLFLSSIRSTFTANDTLTLNTEFRIMNTKWQPILNYVEESDFFLRALWGRLRPLYMRFNELSGEALFYAYRKNNCCRCGCCCQSCHEVREAHLPSFIAIFIPLQI